MVRWCASILAIGIIFAFGYGDVHCEHGKILKTQDVRTDIVKVDSSYPENHRERPQVLFYHDLHTDALAGEKDHGCNTCHQIINGRFSTNFISPQITIKKDRMKAYHDRCIGCHSRFVSSGKTAGPVICSGCHVTKPAVKNVSVSGRFDKSLHQRHSKSLNKSCESCHHLYNSEKKTLYYEKGKEQSCVYCHPEKENGKDISLKNASHLQCVVCHETRLSTGKKAGPLNCEGCHDATIRKSIKKADQIERIMMGQKDYVLMKNTIDPTKAATTDHLKYVPFDHKNHEIKNDNCTLCHHKALSRCGECHTEDGLEKGGNIRLEKALHMHGTNRSCIGCHENRRKSRECAGCHSFDTRWKRNTNKTCDKCHSVTDSKGDGAAVSARIIKEGIVTKNWPDLSRIPETIEIKKIAKKYQAVTFPHRKIVKSLSEKTGKSRLAVFFHSDNSALCLGCHHNSPATATPASCSSCHRKIATKKTANRPALLGAYHLQCMECHSKMGIRQSEGCTGCHKEK